MKKIDLGLLFQAYFIIGVILFIPYFIIVISLLYIFGFEWSSMVGRIMCLYSLIASCFFGRALCAAKDVNDFLETKK